MVVDSDKVRSAKAVLEKMAQGINPVTGGTIAPGNFLEDPRIIRCLYFVAEILQKVLEGTAGQRAQASEFCITGEEKARIRLPEGSIGVNQFAKSVNAVLDPAKSRPLSGVEINKRLKRMGILGEQAEPDGKKKTVVMPDSGKYGIHTERRSYNGTEYEKIVFDEQGKQFLLDNLERIMGESDQPTPAAEKAGGE